VSGLANQLVVLEREEVARGVRLLLARPLLTERAAPEEFDLVRRRREPITLWFEYYCGWQLLVEPRLGYARLFKVRMATDPTRPARRLRSGRPPFDRRRYVLLCVVAAELLTVPVITIGMLADRVLTATATDPVLAAFEPSARAERRAFVDVLRLLESYGALEVVDGSTDAYVDAATAKVLYQVDGTLLVRLLAAPVGPSRLATPVEEVPLRGEELLHAASRERRYGETEDGHPVSPTQRNLWLRHAVFRRLIDDPVLYFDDLTADERGYLTSPTGRQLVRRAAADAGFVAEERAEGVLFVDPDGIATDSRFPDDVAVARVAGLLLLDRLDRATAVEQLHAVAAELFERFPRWAAQYREADGAAQLVSDALEVLAGHGLVRVSAGLVHPLPAAARYAVGDVRTGPIVEESS
jgi:uncharacterized protein (TIGR02678 family)